MVEPVNKEVENKNKEVSPILKTAGAFSQKMYSG